MNYATRISLPIGIVLLLAALLGLGIAETCLAASSSNLAGTTWRPLRVGAGGFATGLDISPDGSTRVVRADTYGAYIWNNAGAQWMQLVTASSMPALDAGVGSGEGVYEIRIAPNLPTRLYMAYRGYIYRSDDKGSHWTRTNFTKVPMDANDDFRMLGQKMAVDPVDPNVVYLGTPNNGLSVTANGGGTWQNVSAVPGSLKNSGGKYPGITGIEFAPALGVAGGRANTIFAASYGHGVYESTDGGASWSAIGGPSAVAYAAVSSSGIDYAVGNGNSLWSYKNDGWSELLSDTSGNGIETVAINPLNPSEIVVQTPGGNLNISYNAGQTWSGYNSTNRFNASDIPWLAGSGSYMTMGGAAFDPLVPNKLWVSDGVGVWNTSLPTTNFQRNTPVIWNDQSAGIEQLVAIQIISPPGGRPLLASWDRPVFYVDDPERFSSSYGPDNQNAIVMGWALDYASTDPTFIVGLFNWWNVEKSAYSRDGGRTWAPFASYPPIIAAGKIGGSIAASTPSNFIWAPSNNSSPYYTNDGGVTWKPISIDGVPTTGETGWGFAYYLNRHIVAADRVAAGTFYMYNSSKGLYRSSDGGARWTLVHSGEIAPWSGFNAKLQLVPGHAGHLFFTSGPQGGPGDHHPAASPFMRSIDGGATWTAVPNVLEVRAFGFGKAAIFIVGWVNGQYGIWRSDDNAQSWVQIGDFPLGSLDNVVAIEGNKDVYGTVYIGFTGSGYAYGSLRR